MKKVPEDIAHISVHANQHFVLDLLDEYFKDLGYRRVVVEGKSHLLRNPNWESPFGPPPMYRCFLLLPENAGWTNVTDELDLLDRNLALWLSTRAQIITVIGYSCLNEFTYQPYDGGVTLADLELDADFMATLSFIRSNPDHVTKFSYDDLCLTFHGKSKIIMPLIVGYMLLQQSQLA